MLIKNGTVYDAIHSEPFVADIKVTNGKISEIGQSLTADAGEEIIDASGLRVYPGFIDYVLPVGKQTPAAVGAAPCGQRRGWPSAGYIPVPLLRCGNSVRRYDQQRPTAPVCPGAGALLPVRAIHPLPAGPVLLLPQAAGAS